ncbi:cytochrome o quinol oxidase subunit II [Fictibacillus macauensis ZFHKF-1]|uniref:Quinol oxidase subunit 2 n=1 Tax=Fictibacillus macauensis ZFHKF-1 TaxID=1196324 RepID=I8AM20_9BACL|nr:cytochrome c oxidase subunit II [Fictibacillus macauensis]EIT86977.1 cytochrome o quinol oxidase subunit II [Fictibacillus macauensis ZFHKF-1]
MNKRRVAWYWKILLLTTVSSLFLSGCDRQYLVFNPAGPVAQKEYDLIVLSAVLCAIVVIPVLALLFFILYRYRDRPGNKAKYSPNWHDSKILEVVWWGIPIIIIGILSIYTAKTTYTLTKPPVKDVKPITIQVTSMDWKWLFQYPGQKIATVNYAEIPVGVPVQFHLTSNQMMNSFWVPELGGQEYTMPGMAMRLWLQADRPGTYYGSGANFTGKGFTHMKFKVIAKPQAEFDQWARQIKQTEKPLTMTVYKQLAKKGLAEKQAFSSYPAQLFTNTLNENGGKYMDKDMKHGKSDMPAMNHNDHDMSGMEHKGE